MSETMHHKLRCGKRHSLCWICKHSVPNPERGIGCNWSVLFKPVPGWDAEFRKQQYKRPEGYFVLDSYFVFDCPRFEQDCEPEVRRREVDPDALETCGNFLKRLRLEHGLTQSEVAKAVGRTEDAISKWEQGRRFPRDTQIQMLAELYGVPFLEIRFGRKQDAENGECRPTD